MTSQRYNSNDNVPFTGRFEDINGNAITNATGEIFIRRLSDNQYWNGGAFQVARVSIPMAEVDETNAPGEWIYNFDTSVGLSVDDYIAEIVDTSGNAKNQLSDLFAYVGGYLSGIQESLQKVIGLLHENYVLEPTSHDVNLNMTGADVRIYDSALNATNDNGTGLIESWTVTSPHDAMGRLIKHTMVKD